MRKANVANRTPWTDLGPCRSTRERQPVQRLIYDGYVVRHYAYMAKVVQDVEPICFEDVVGHALWDKAMGVDGCIGCKQDMGVGAFA